MGTGPKTWALALATLALWPQAARAAELEPFEPSREENLLGLAGVDIATGWVPAGSAIQVSFDLHVGDTVRAEMLGDAAYDWLDQSMTFTGDAEGGLFAIDVGVLLDARVRFDLLGMQYESPLVGPYDLVAEGGVLFDPYLLPGNPDRPALIDVQTEPTEVYTYTLVDAFIASGEFVVDAAFDVQVALRCESIEVGVVDEANGEAAPAWVVEELEAVDVLAPSAGTLAVDATLRCTTVSTLTILLYPSVVVTLGLQEFELSPFELPVPVLTDAEAPWDFDPIALLFEDVIPPPSADSGGDGSGSGEEPTGSSGEDDGPAYDTGSATGGSVGEASEAGDDAGCGCVSQPGRGGWAAWGMLALFAFGRRNTKRQPPSRARCGPPPCTRG